MEQNSKTDEKFKTKNPANMYKFHLIVKGDVDRILIYRYLNNNSIDYINDMKMLRYDEGEFEFKKIFNGSLPFSLAGEKLQLKLCLYEGTADYVFNELFSEPASEEVI